MLSSIQHHDPIPMLPGPDKHSWPPLPKTTAIFEAFTATYQKICCCMIFQSIIIKNKKHNVWGGILSFFYFCSPFLDETLHKFSKFN
jgi:hypothetical protein